MTETGEEKGATQATPQSSFLISILAFFLVSLMVQMAKASASNAGDPGSIPGWGRSSGEGSGNPLQYSCLENPMDGGSSQAIVHGVAKSDTTELLHFPSFSYPSKWNYSKLYRMITNTQSKISFCSNENTKTHRNGITWTRSSPSLPLHSSPPYKAQ